MFEIIIMHLCNLGMTVVYESIYKIKNKRHVKKVNIFSKPNTSKVRDSGPECQAATAQEWPAEATSCLRPGAVTLRSHPEPKAKAGGQGEQPE